MRGSRLRIVSEADQATFPSERKKALGERDRYMDDTINRNPATRIIALEEAFLHPKLRERYSPRYVVELDLLKGRLTDVGPERIRRMDAAGIDVQVLSHVSPGVQTLDADTAVRLSKEANDWLGGIIQRISDTFCCFRNASDPVAKRSGR
jgi:predicted TIM-barrel fold metal-dependent hydrolase